MVGERIKQIRKENGLTLDQFGDRIGLKKSALSQFERGTANPSDRTVRSICREFSIREAWLRDGEEPMRAEQSREEQINGFIQQALSEEPEGVRRRLVSALAKLDESDWIALDKAWSVWMKITGDNSK